MEHQCSRTEMLIGTEGLAQLKQARVAIFGVGGVGGYVAEALARAGVGKLDLIDNDCISISNLNRQIIATHSTIGRKKVEVMKERVLDINPGAEVRVYQCFFLPDTSNEFDFTQYSYVVDAIDTVTGKLEIIMKSKEANVPVISSMGTGNKMDPSKLQIADINNTSVCPLAKVMRKECRNRNIKKLKVIYSTEEAIKPVMKEQIEKPVPGSISFVPSVAGLMIAGEVIRDLIGWRVT